MPEWVTEALAAATPYWPFLVKMIFFWYVGNHMKKRVFTRVRAAKGGFWGFSRETMWAHPMLAGVGMGLMYPYLPAVEFVTTQGGAILEGVFAGIASTVGFMALSYLAEKRGWTVVSRVLHDTGRPTSAPPAPTADETKPKIKPPPKEN